MLVSLPLYVFSIFIEKNNDDLWIASKARSAWFVSLFLTHSTYLVDIFHTRVTFDHFVIVISSMMRDQINIDSISRWSDQVRLNSIAESNKTPRGKKPHLMLTYYGHMKKKYTTTYKKYPQWTVDAFAARESSWPPEISSHCSGIAISLHAGTRHSLVPPIVGNLHFDLLYEAEAWICAKALDLDSPGPA